MLKALTIFLGEDADGLIKEYLVSFNSLSEHLVKGTQKKLTVRTNITREP